MNKAGGELNSGGFDREFIKEKIDENFEIASRLLQAINDKHSTFDIISDFEKLYYNLLGLEPYLTQKIYDIEEYSENLKKMEYLQRNAFKAENPRKFFNANRDVIVELVNFFINSKSKNVRLKSEDIWFQVEWTKKLVTWVLWWPLTQAWSKMRWIESDKVKEANIVSYNPEMENRALFIWWINTVVEPRTEFTDPDHDIYGTWFWDASVFPKTKKLLAKIPPLERKFKESITPTNYDWKDRINASWEWTNFAWIADILAERWYGMDFLNQFHMWDRKHVEAAIKKAQEFLESEEGQKVEVLVCHSYGWTIAKALDLSKTNVKKVVTISSPLWEHPSKEALVTREKYAKSVANRNVEWISSGSEIDKVVPAETSMYADEKHIDNTELDHWKWTYVQKIDTEKLEKVFDEARLRKK